MQDQSTFPRAVQRGGQEGKSPFLSLVWVSLQHSLHPQSAGAAVQSPALQQVVGWLLTDPLLAHNISTFFSSPTHHWRAERQQTAFGSPPAPLTQMHSIWNLSCPFKIVAKKKVPSYSPGRLVLNFCVCKELWWLKTWTSCLEAQWGNYGCCSPSFWTLACVQNFRGCKA